MSVGLCFLIKNYSEGLYFIKMFQSYVMDNHECAEPTEQQTDKFRFLFKCNKSLYCSLLVKFRMVYTQ
jgi:hypothetical protein